MKLGGRFEKLWVCASIKLLLPWFHSHICFRSDIPIKAEFAVVGCGHSNVLSGSLLACGLPEFLILVRLNVNQDTMLGTFRN